MTDLFHLMKANLVRYLYSLLFYIALPFVFVRLWWRSRRQPDYKKRLAERLGFYPYQLEKCIWVHAVSMGETIAAVPLIKALQARYPHLPMLITTMTPTGAAKVKVVFGDKAHHAYLPYDLPYSMQRFINTFHPVIGVIMETELWPNLLACCQMKHIPVCLVNARLSEKSARAYARIPGLTRTMLQSLQHIAAHGEPDAQRFIQLGAIPQRVTVTGNIKFDLELPDDLALKSAALREALGQNRFIWIAASTHEGEEDIILAAHQKLRVRDPNALLVLVPRHPDRFDAVAKLSAQSFATVRRSMQDPCTAETAVYLADTMGEMLLLYGAADVAFVGGSLIPRGGHNILEPGALGKPILSGPHIFNFQEISAMFIAADALITVNNTDELSSNLLSLLENAPLRAKMSQQSLQVVAKNRGALKKQIRLIEHILDTEIDRNLAK